MLAQNVSTLRVCVMVATPLSDEPKIVLGTFCHGLETSCNGGLPQRWYFCRRAAEFPSYRYDVTVC